MSRARPIYTPDGEVHWFDMQKKGEPATDLQLELLATIAGVELDDLLDEVVKQADVVERLRDALGQNGIPEEIVRKRQEWREERHTLPACRKCGKEGDSTKHHFINKWILRELEYYTTKWADRSKNCIPLCIHCHRDIHSRANGPNSIAGLLTDQEKDFAQAALQALAEERPKLLILIACGDDSVYEARLVKDWIEGSFRTADAAPVSRPDILLELAA